jgi:hypothetical protein
MMHTSAQIFFLLLFYGKKSRRKVDRSVTLKKKYSHNFFRVAANNQPEAASVDVKQWLSSIAMKTTVIPPLPAPAFLMDSKATMGKRLALRMLKRHKR